MYAHVNDFYASFLIDFATLNPIDDCMEYDAAATSQPLAKGITSLLPIARGTNKRGLFIANRIARSKFPEMYGCWKRENEGSNRVHKHPYEDILNIISISTTTKNGRFSLQAIRKARNGPRNSVCGVDDGLPTGQIS